MSKHFNAKKGIAMLLSVLSTCGAASAADYGGDYSRFGSKRYSIDSRTEFDASNTFDKGANSGMSDASDLGGTDLGSPIRRRRKNPRSTMDQQLNSSNTDSNIGNGTVNFDSNRLGNAPASSVVADRQGTWNPFKVGYEGIKGAYQGMKGLNLSTWQKVFAGLTLTELTLYLAKNKGIGEIVSGLIFDTVATNFLRIPGKEDTFAGDRILYNYSLTKQNAIIDKMPPVIDAVARLFSCLKGNWIDWAVALVCGIMGKEEKDVYIVFSDDNAKQEFGKDIVAQDMSLANPEDTKKLLREYFETVGARFRPTRINMLFYNIGSKINKAVKKGMAPGGNPTPRNSQE